jgi:hypothetical protein
MNKEFVPYNQALALKELGFDEPCFGYYIETGECIPASYSREGTVYPSNSDLLPGWVSAPTYSAAFRWFREKHGNFYDILQFDGGLWGYSIYGQVGFEAIFEHNKFKTYEEAESACLDKLIEIVKEKTQ